MEKANNLNSDGSYVMKLLELQAVIQKMNGDKVLMKYMSGKVDFSTPSENPAFIRLVLGTILALTSGSDPSRKLGMRI